MTKSPVYAGSFIATLSEFERNMLTDVQDKLRAERSVGKGPQETIELPLKWCQDIIVMHRQGEVSDQGGRKVLDWALRNPEKVESLTKVVETQGLRLFHERGNPQAELEKLSANHAKWREAYSNDPEQAKRETIRAIMISGCGLCNPSDIQEAVTSFFNAPVCSTEPSEL